MILDMDLECLYVSSCFSLIISFNNSNVDDTIWHTRLGHISQDRMTRLARDDLLGWLANVN